MNLKLRHKKEGNTYAGSRKQELGLARWRSAVCLPEVLFDMSGRRDAAYEWGTADDEKPDYRVLPTTLPAHPFHCGPSDRPSNTSIQGLVAVCQTSFMPSLENLRQTISYQRNHTVGTSTSANTPLSLRTNSCYVYKDYLDKYEDTDLIHVDGFNIEKFREDLPDEASCPFYYS